MSQRKIMKISQHWSIKSLPTDSHYYTSCTKSAVSLFNTAFYIIINKGKENANKEKETKKNMITKRNSCIQR